MKIEITKEMAMFKNIQTVDTGMPSKIYVREN
jgi:hypothetical protein